MTCPARTNACLLCQWRALRCISLTSRSTAARPSRCDFRAATMGSSELGTSIIPSWLDASAVWYMARSAASAFAWLPSSR
eukprot:6176332-Pleurochrysis_carterae.AAC.1